MSKRACGANFGGDEERYGKSGDSNSMADSDKPLRATAAQMAKRKIAQARSTGRRSASPAVSTASAGAPNTQFQVPTQGGFSFSFGNTNASFGQQPQQNGSPAPVSFGSANNTNAFQANANSFGTSFGNSAAQPQQNGFTPTASFSFGQQQPQQSQPQSAPSFQFGQTQSNGTTPDLGTSSIFKSFGQQNQQNGQNGTSFQFSASQPDPKPANGGFAFGQQSQASSGDQGKSSSPATFGSLNQSAQQNGDKPLFGAGSQNKSFGSSTLGTSTLFGNVSQKPSPSVENAVQEPSTAPSSVFSSMPSSQQPPKPASSNIFDFASQAQTNGDRPETVPQTPSTSIFGNLGQTHPNGVQAAANVSQTPAQTPFTGVGQTPATQTKTSSFGNSQLEQQTPKATNIFGHLASQPQNTDAQQDTSMTTPDQTPQKPSKATTSVQPEPLTATPAAPLIDTQPRSLLDRADKSEIDKALGKPAGSLFSFKPSEQQNNIPPSSFFTVSKPPGTFGLSAQATTPKPSTSDPAIVSAPEPPKTAPPKSMFDHAQPSQTTLSQPQNGGLFGGNRPTPPSRPAETSAEPPPAVQTSNSGSLTPQQRQKLIRLNSGLLKHLQASDMDRDWSAVFKFYLSQVTKISPSDTTTPKTAAPSSSLFSKPQETAPAQKRRLFEDDDDDAAAQAPATEKRLKPNESMNYPKLPETASKTARLFAATLEKPNDTPSISKEAGFTPISKSTISDKPTDTPSKPDENPLFKSGFTPFTKQTTEPSAPAPRPTSGFTPTFSVSDSTTPKPTSGFTPSFSTTSSATNGSNSGFKPTFSTPAGGVDMFAAFGKAAKAQEEKDRNKRKDEDYDSDDETQEEWEKRDKEEQELKRAKIAEAAKSGSGFTFKDPNATNKPSQETAPGINETPKTQPKSLFDRITPASPPKTAPSKPSIFSAQTPNSSSNSSTQLPATAVHKSTSNIFGGLQAGAEKPSTNIFSFLSDKGKSSQHGEEVEKELGTGDKTFKPDTPIKFGAAATSTPSTAPPTSAVKSTGLFGSSTPQFGPAGSKLAPPSSSFTFGAGLKANSLDVSRSNTPAATTDGEGSTANGADDADGEEQNLPQVEDQTELQADEKRENEVLFELGSSKNALCKKFEDRNGTKEWVLKGKGRLYILKHKETGKTRIMIKIAPYGKLAMNYEPVSGIAYKVMTGSGKMVSGSFIDHIHSKEPKLGQFLIMVKEPEDAKEIARILTEQASE